MESILNTSRYLLAITAKKKIPVAVELVDLKRVPSWAVLESFFTWMVRTKAGQSNRRRCVGTLKREFDIVARVLKLHTGHNYTKEERRAMKAVSLVYIITCTMTDT